MAITVRCRCGKEMRFADQFTGRQARCPGCGAGLLVAEGSPQASPAMSSSGSRTKESPLPKGTSAPPVEALTFVMKCGRARPDDLRDAGLRGPAVMDIAGHAVRVVTTNHLLGRAAWVALLLTIVSLVIYCLLQGIGAFVVVPGYLGWFFILYFLWTDRVVLEIDTRTLSAIYDPNWKFASLELPDGRWVTARFRMRDRGLDEVFLTALRASYGERLTVDSTPRFDHRDKVELAILGVLLAALALVIFWLIFL